MKISKQVQRLLFVMLAIAAFGIGYVAMAGLPFTETRAAERAAVMPEQPHIFYLAPKGMQRGALDEQTVIEKGGTIPEEASWEAAKEAALQKPLDALLVDESLIAQMTPGDQAWLRAQAKEGVVIVGLGADDQLAEALGVSTFLAPAEAVIPAGETDYRLVNALLLAHPEDMQKLDGLNWLERLAQSEENGPFDDLYFNHPLLYSFGTRRSTLDTEEGVDNLFASIHIRIEGNYAKRAEFQETTIKAAEEQK